MVTRAHFLPLPVYAPESGYTFGAAPSSAATSREGGCREPGDEDPKCGAEAVYLRKFAAVGLSPEMTYGLGRPTRAEHGGVVSASLTAEDLHRHAQKFGPEYVAETAKAFGGEFRNVAAAPKSKAKRQRRTTASFRDQVLNLHRRGVVPAAIADTLNVVG